MPRYCGCCCGKIGFNAILGGERAEEEEAGGKARSSFLMAIKRLFCERDGLFPAHARHSYHGGGQAAGGSRQKAEKSGNERAEVVFSSSFYSLFFYIRSCDASLVEGDRKRRTRFFSFKVSLFFLSSLENFFLPFLPRLSPWLPNTATPPTAPGRTCASRRR